MNAIRRAAFGRQPISTRPGSSRSAAGKDAILRARHRASQLAALAALRRAGFAVGPPPEGAYYIFAGYRGVPALAGLGPREAAMRMTAEFKVACVPGDNFYLGERAKRHPELGGRYLRFTFVRSLDVLRDAAAKLEALAACTP